MEQIYRRVKDIDEKIKNTSLPYFDWKVLFLVSDDTPISEINSILDKDTEAVTNSLESLKSKGLLELVGDEPVESDTKVQEKAVEEEPKSSQEVEEISETIEDTGLEEDETIELEQMQDEAKPDEEPKSEEEFDFTSEIKEEKPEAIEEIPEEKMDIAEVEQKESEVVQEESILESLEPEDDEVTAAEMTDFIDEISETKDSEADKAGVEKETTEEVVQEEKTISETKEDTSKDEEVISDVSKKTIMVIDDSIVIRKMIEIALEDEDYRIVTAISGKEGMNVLDKDNPNLVILDMMLPDMNGIDVLKTIKASKKIPVIMLSGKDSPQLIESAKDVGVDEFLPKPFRDEELVEKVKNLIG